MYPQLGDPFTFIDPGELSDKELSLQVEEYRPAQPEKAYAPSYEFALMVGGNKVGRLNLRAQSTHLLEQLGGHIGYEVDEAYRGNGYACRACRLILPLAKAHGFQELMMSCNPDNTPSIRTLRRLGCQYLGDIDVPTDHEMYQLGDRQKMRWSLSLESVAPLQ